jgi:hypothetical protein
VTIPAPPNGDRGNPLRHLSAAVDEDIVEPAAGTDPGLWLGRVGTAVSVVLFGLSIRMLVEMQTPSCPADGRASVSVDLTPLVFFAVSAIALALDIRAIRRGGASARWGRVGLAAVSSAAVLVIVAAAQSLFGATASCS